MKNKLLNILTTTGLIAFLSISAHTQGESNFMMIISPDNFPQIFPGSIGQPTLLVSFKDNTNKFISLERGAKTVYSKSPIKDAYIVFGGNELRNAPCKDEEPGKSAKTVILKINYQGQKGNENFSCVISK